MAACYVTNANQYHIVDFQNYYKSMRFYFYGVACNRFAPKPLPVVHEDHSSRVLRRKLLMIMKLTSLLLLVACLNVCAKGIGQKVSFTGRNVPVEQVFSAIEKQTGYVVFFDYASLGGVKNVTVSVKDAGITELLRACFKDESIDFSIQGRNILISRKQQAEGFVPPPPPVDLKGKVIDSLGNPLPGATIMFKGSKKGIQADEKGEFTLKGIGEETPLVISYTGFETRELKTPKNTATTFYVILKASSNPLDETVVQAYGTVSKRYNVGSIAKIGREEIQSQPVMNPLAALEGRVPGLLVTTQSGIPGAMMKVQVRGQNTIGSSPMSPTARTPDNPLFIIDGVPFAPQNNAFDLLQNITYNNGNYGGGLSPFGNINPADIESIEVLKDADATAIYGARGANGVIIISTRKANVGKVTMNGNISSGFSRVSRTMPMMNTEQYLQMRRQAFANDKATPGLNTWDSYAPDLLLFDQNKHTDFMKDLFGGTATTLSASLFLSGGSPTNSFSLSAGYDKESNYFPGTFLHDRMSINSGLHHSSSDRRFSADFTTGYSYSRNALPGNPSITSAFTLTPNFPDLLNPDGSLIWDYKGTAYSSIISGFTNPYAYLKQKSDVGSQNLLTNLALSYRLLPGLTLRSNMGYNLFTSNEYRIYPIASQDPFSYYLRGVANKANSSSYSWNIEPQLNYVRKIGQGKLDVMAGLTFLKMAGGSTVLSGTNYLNDQFLNNITAAGTITVSDSYSPYKYHAVFGRVNYIHANKYILNLTGRADGSSRFIEGRRWAQFGAVGAGWIFTEENFAQPLRSVLSFGKLRGSYGSTGNDNVADYMYYSNWKVISNINNYFGSPGYTPTNLNNPDYSWSITKKLEFGLDAGFLNDKILLGVSWFRNRSSNQLVQYALPTQTGFNNVTRNFQAMIENSGWEFVLTATPLKGKNLTMKSSLNLSVPKNKLVAFPGLESSSYGNIFVVGQSVSLVRGYSFAGINETTGIAEFNTKAGGKTMQPVAINGDNKFILGNSDPRFFGGLRNTLTWKKLQVDIFLEFRKQWGPNFFNSLDGTPGGIRNMPVELLDSWTKPGDKTRYQKLTQTYVGAGQTMSYLKMSDFSYSDASYIRFKTLGLSYTLDGEWLKKIKMGSCRIYMNAQNLFVITKYRGHDPETLSFYSIPPLKTISCGLQFNF
ncbi:SusC/RagA family TonB-linked outer membrane protein [Filimonas effusa]|uniref:SusC/RagA family TonB-linked outer membrane protein n=2 Tax=Filimonas effusa TaxID=2508721 RepID=A0A4V1MAF6_9BACT|nr:SusC/RagA family TonB-linked outer membrane protein [Filimonas effusa]